jgi:alanine racemase
MSRAARALIDLEALQHNFRKVQELAPNSKILAVIKADGYGHGIVRMARNLRDADAFAVASLEEAETLREAGIKKPIVLLEGIFNASELAVAADQNLEIVVHHKEQLELLESVRTAVPLQAWLKIDTGMHRLGFAPEQAKAAWQRLHDCTSITDDVRLMTHLANADDREDLYTEEQIRLFDNTVTEMDGKHSIANSAGILAWPEAHRQWVRPGIMLYGVSPFNNASGADLGLKPVMNVSTRLIAVNRFRQGDSIGYGGTWVCPEDMNVGVAAIGYGDGYPRHAESGTTVLVNKNRASLIGRVSMDMITIDLRGQPEAKIGDPVHLWGEGLPAEEIAGYASTIAYELLCGVTRRVHFSETL